MVNYDGSRFCHRKRRPGVGELSSAKTSCIWYCEICGFKFNRDHAKKCEMCGQKGPVTQFGVGISKCHYLCSVHSARPPQKVDLLKALNVTTGKTLEVVLDGTTEADLPIRIIRTFVREIGPTQDVRDEIVRNLSTVLRGE